MANATADKSAKKASAKRAEASSLQALLWRLPHALARLNARAESISGKWPEGLVLCLFCVLKAVMGVFHEPWFDEAVAWQIAREASLWDLLFSVPHYEGHPPLWHLVLAPFAKLGAPYELSLCAVSLVFMAAAMFLLLWFAPFPRLVKWALPFTYFCCYQFAVISRPYAMMALAFVLLALAFSKRNERPARYVGALAFLCLTSAFGIALAGGLAAAWVLEILREKPLLDTLKGAVFDRRVWWLAALLLLAIALLLEILPAADAYAVVSKTEAGNGLSAQYVLYMLFGMTADCLLTSGYTVYEQLFFVNFSGASFWSSCLVGAGIWVLLLWLARRKGLTATLVIPYLLFAGCGVVAYFCNHHIGIAFWFLLFFVWVALNEPNRVQSQAEELPDAKETETAAARQMSTAAVVSAVASVAVALSLLVSLYWNVSSCVTDRKEPYSTARATVSFLKDHKLDRLRVMSGWINDEERTDINLNLAADMMPYFDRNIFFNFADGEDRRNFITHRYATESETQAAFARWRAGGAPDVLVYEPLLAPVYGDTVPMWEYAVVFHTVGGKIWKGAAMMDNTSVLVRRELLPQLGLRELTIDEILAIDRRE